MTHKIVVIGSSNTDMIVQVPQIPRPGETIIGGVFSTAAGGKGANQAVAAARAGGDVAFVARVGKDIFGDQARAGFIAAGIDIEHVGQDEIAPSGVALIFVAQDGENSIAVAPGANAMLSRDDVVAAENLLSQADIIIMQLETSIEAVRAALNLAQQYSVPVMLNPAPAQTLPDDIIRQIAILTPNEHETETLTGVAVTDENSAKCAAEKLLAKGVQSVLITMGAKGAFVATQDDRKLISGFRVTAIDSTAAGDVFNGSLGVALAEGKSLFDAAHFANAAAAISVTRLGAQPSAPFRHEIEDFINRNRS